MSITTVALSRAAEAASKDTTASINAPSQDNEILADTSTPATQPKKINIRVLLQEEDTSKRIPLVIKSPHGFIVESIVDPTKKARWPEKELHLTTENNNLLLLKNGQYKRIKANDLCITPANGVAQIDAKSYQGMLNIRIDATSKMLQIINKIDLDDYIYSVLRFESLSHWPHEMHKVQAIASRTYAIYQIRQARSKTQPQSFYDIKNNNFHQVYNGVHTSTHLRKAVDETKNLILTYNGYIALTMFDICCGGVIPGYMKRKDLDKPYLFRTNKCTYCKGKTPYEWEKSIHKQNFWELLVAHPRLTKKLTGLGRILGIGIKEKDKAGIVHKVVINGSRKNVSITRNELRSALTPTTLKSDSFTIRKHLNGIELRGLGFGHHTGLCQIGARELVARGWSHTAILDFYFPKTKLSRIKAL